MTVAVMVSTAAVTGWSAWLVVGGTLACLLAVAVLSGALPTSALRDRLAVALLVAVVLATVASRTAFAAAYYYDMRFYCATLGWIDWWNC